MLEAKTNYRPKTVLFACTLNAVRSPMAAALLRHLAGSGIAVESAGVEAGPLDPLAAEALSEIGVTLAGHKPRALTPADARAYDLVITLSPEAQTRADALASAGHAEHWQVADPTGQDGSREQRLCAYRAVRDDLLKKLKTRFSLAPA